MGVDTWLVDTYDEMIVQRCRRTSLCMSVYMQVTRTVVIWIRVTAGCLRITPRPLG